MLGLMGFSRSLPCMLFIDIISLFINWANKDACLFAQLNSTPLNSTSSRRHVRNVNNCHLSMNVVTQFVGHDVINKNTTDLAVRCSTGSLELS